MIATPTLFPTFPKWIAVLMYIIAAFLFFFTMGYYLYKRIFPNRKKDIKLESPLKIIFDQKNPEKRFWSLENNPQPTHWEHRVEVRNISSKTIKNVCVTTEHMGTLSNRPRHQMFDINKKQSYNINPSCNVLVPVVTWPHPKIQVGMLADQSAWSYGPIKVIASAEDVEPTVKIFRFNYQTEQMLFE